MKTCKVTKNGRLTGTIVLSLNEIVGADGTEGFLDLVSEEAILAAGLNRGELTDFSYKAIGIKKGGIEIKVDGSVSTFE